MDRLRCSLLRRHIRLPSQKPRICIRKRSKQRACIVETLNGHGGCVNCVKWVACKKAGWSGSEVLVSGSADKSICIWKWNGEAGKKLATLQGCASGVTAVATRALLVKDALLAVYIIACSADPEAKIFRCSISDDDTVRWDVSMMPSTATVHHSVAIASMAGDTNHHLVALGGTDAIVRLFVWDGEETVMVCKLVGHEDWIRGLDFRSVSNSKMLLASASQDRFIRVWALTSEASASMHPLEQLAPSKRFTAGNVHYTVKLEGLLTGHEDRVHSVQFHPDPSKLDVDVRSRLRGDLRLQLLSASMDRTMIVWQWDEADRCWEQIDSVGDAGSSALGYFGGVYSPDGNAIVAHGFTGALHMWQKEKTGWMPILSSTGHYGPVMDMCLSCFPSSSDREGIVYLLSVGKDQTTRLWMILDGKLKEVARPQVHGHDFHAVSVIPHGHVETFVSCSEEKVIRVFSAAINFYQYLQTNGLTDAAPVALEQKRMAYGASIKALALTNTAVYEGDAVASEDPVVQGVVATYAPGPDFAPNSTPSCMTGTPLEEHLSQNTLWPEIQKLYGHGDVVYSLTASPCGQWLASSCKAQKEDTAVIFVWNTTTWKPHQTLRGHVLTVTRMAFSSNGQYLLSGSRDRTFCLFENRNGEFRFLARKNKAHNRIIWDVSWAANDLFFATASRDQTFKIWRVSDLQCVRRVVLESGVAAIAFFPNIDVNFLAIGLENGEISVWSIDSENHSACAKQWCTNDHDRHVDAVHRLLWIHNSLDGDQTALLASCSADHSVRLFRIGCGPA